MEGDDSSYFKPIICKIFLVLALLFVVVILVQFARYAVTPVNHLYIEKNESERGAIVDRNGAPLAVQTVFYDIGYSPNKIKKEDIETFARVMAPALEMSPDAIIDNYYSYEGAKFAYLKKRVDQAVYADVKAVVEDYKYNHVSADKVPGRIYPNHSLASHLIGYMGKEGNGMSGIEYSQQDILASKKSGDAYEAGKNVYLTIDANLQYKLEQIAFDTMNETKCQSMMLIAADATSGEILSYVSLPEADLNEYGSSTSEQQFDHLRMEAYEPGSVFKIFTVSILYDEGRIKQNDSFLCDGMYEYRPPRGETIRIKCLEHHGWLTPRDVISLSCNDAIGQIADRIGEEEFIARIRRLGFGQKTGIELSGETAAIVKDPGSRSWSGRSKPTIAIGQEITVSALQMVQAATAIANDGVPVKLSVISKITNKDGSLFYEHKPEYKERVFHKNTADYVLSCMETTSLRGNGTRANISDISIGTKTGTAQMADKEKGGYSDTDYLSSCIGIFPTENPEIILYVVIEKAQGEVYGGRIAAPVIQKAANTIIDHLGMSRGGAASLEHNGMITIARGAQVEIGETVPDFTGLNKRELSPLLDRSDISVSINGSGWVTSQNPEPGTVVTENMTIELYLE
ncbi:MAG: transpeptidase family protein [Treponema sp.]|nr:transpeptidase family protein [Treponema sp.]